MCAIVCVYVERSISFWPNVFGDTLNESRPTDRQTDKTSINCTNLRCSKDDKRRKSTKRMCMSLIRAVLASPIEVKVEDELNYLE